MLSGAQTVRRICTTIATAAIILAFQDVSDESYVVGMIVMPADPSDGRAHITNTRYRLDKKSAIEDYIARVRRDVLR